jgi:hypothetical protein
MRSGRYLLCFWSARIDRVKDRGCHDSLTCSASRPRLKIAEKRLAFLSEGKRRSAKQTMGGRFLGRLTGRLHAKIQRPWQPGREPGPKVQKEGASPPG